MNTAYTPDAYEFDVHLNELTFKPSARLFSLTDIKSSKRLLSHLEKNHVSTLVCDISQALSIDSNAESLLYQINQYFAADAQKGLLVKADGNSNLQNRLVSNLYKLNTNIQLEFI